LAVTLVLMWPLDARSQAAGQAVTSARAVAPIDLTGYWVAIVNEDWRWRMMTPPKGDYASVPLNAEGRTVGNRWEPSLDGRCEAYGAAAVMRLPTRLHITWESEQVLTIETDAGRQTRRLHFDQSARPLAERTRLGCSAGEWQIQRAVGGFVPGPAGGSLGRGGAVEGATLKVVTTHLLPGWLRRNGVPYSKDAVVTEHYVRFRVFTGDEWLVVTTVVNDPRYLDEEFVTSSHFRKEPDGSKWDPYACRDD
jgi:hypothetical protein